MDDKEAMPAQRGSAVSAPARTSPASVLSKHPLISMLLAAFVMAGAAIIGYLSLLSSNTVTLVGDISRLQYESEQLRYHVTAHFPAPPQADLTAAIRRTLLELKNREIREPYKQDIDAVVQHGGQFAEQAEQVWFTHSQLDNLARQLSERLSQGAGSAELQAINEQLAAYLLSVLYPASYESEQASLVKFSELRLGLEPQIARLGEAEEQQVREIIALLQPALSRFVQYQPVTEAVVGSHFPDELRRTLSVLLRFDQELKQAMGWVAFIWAVMTLGFAVYGYACSRRKPVSANSAAKIARAERQESCVAAGAEFGSTAGLPSGENVPEALLIPSRSGKAMELESAGRYLNIPYMVDNMDGDQQAVAMLLEVFLEEHSADAKQLSVCLQAGKHHEAGIIAHSLKSVAGSLGAEPLRQAAEQIEHRCRQGLAVEPVHLSRLSEAIETLKLAIVDYLQSGLPYPEADTSQPMKYKIEKKEESLAVLDTVYMLSTMDDDVESVKILLGVFIDEHAQDAKTLRRMVNGSAPDTISETAFRLIHSLKGVAGSIGAEALQRQAETIESCYKRQQVVADAEYRELVSVLDATVEAAKCYLSELHEAIG